MGFILSDSCGAETLSRRSWALPFSFMMHTGLVVGGIIALVLADADLPPVQTPGWIRPVIPEVSAVVRLEPPTPQRQSAVAAAAPTPGRTTQPVLAAEPAPAPVAPTPAGLITEGVDPTASSHSLFGQTCTPPCGTRTAADPSALVGTGLGGPSGPVRSNALGVQAPIKLHAPAPAYPPLARTAGVQGVVRLDCVIDRDGRVVQVRVLSGSPLLAPAAVAAVERWRYQPGRLNGIPVAVLMTVDVRFQLR